jgi:hypothetical protein
MGNRLLRFQTAPTLLLGVATLLWLPGPAHAQSTTTQDREVVQNDEITHRDLARFDQFLDSHREDAEQLRRTPSLVDDPQFLQSHPELNAYLQDHPNVKQEISQRPDTFMRLEDRYNRDPNTRDRDAGGQNRDADRRDVAEFDRFLDGHREIAEQVRKDPSLLDRREFVQNHAELQTFLQDHPGVRDQLKQDPNAFMRQEDRFDRDSNLRDRDAGGQNRDADHRDVAEFDRFLDGHREIAEQVRKDPSLLDRREFVQNHPELQTFLQDHPEVRDQLKQDPNAFMRQEDRFDRDSNLRDRDAGGQNRDADHRDVAEFDRFLDGHREIAEQVRKDPSLLDRREFVQNHPALQTFLQDNPEVRDQLKQDPNAFMRQEDRFDRSGNGGDRDAMHDRMADFGGFLGGHSDIQRDLSRNPSIVKDHEYVQNHAELNTYLNAHPNVRDDLIANPQSFVKGAQQYSNSATGTTGTTTNPATTTHDPKPKQ